MDPFQCAACEDAISDGPPIHVGNDTTCESCVRNCIVPLFYSALEFEYHWPVVANNIVLRHEDFAPYFDDYLGFLSRWAPRVYEYESKKRLYCKHCSQFLRRLPSTPEEGKSPSAVLCYQCKRTVCGSCGEEGHIADGGTEGKTDAEDKKVEEEDPFKNFPDTKACPLCNTMMYLYSGCNEAYCQNKACRATFCWICFEIDPSKSHWYAGMPCPKWHEPGSPQAQWLQPAPDNPTDDPVIPWPVEMPADFLEADEPTAEPANLEDFAALVLLPTQQTLDQLDQRARVLTE